MIDTTHERNEMNRAADAASACRYENPDLTIVSGLFIKVLGRYLDEIDRCYDEIDQLRRERHNKQQWDAP